MSRVSLPVGCLGWPAGTNRTGKREPAHGPADGVTVKKLVGLVGIAAMTMTFSTLAPADATTPGDQASISLTSMQADKKGWSMRAKFARESARLGDRDTSVYDIDHVRELQYRLSWAGTYDGSTNGNFGKQTKAAVKRYQRREGLHVNGIATHRTWRHLI